MLVDLVDRLAVGVAELLGQDDEDFGIKITGDAVLRSDPVPFHAEFRPLDEPGGMLNVTVPRGVGMSTFAPWTARPT